MSFYGDLLRHGIDADGTRVIFDVPVVPRGDIGKGNIYYVDAANGNDSRNGKTPREALATIAEAFDRCVANQHDTVKLIAGSSGFTLSAALTWNKAYTHLEGIAAPTPNSRARISAATANSLIVSADGCRFQNFRIFQGTDSVLTRGLSVTGSRNYFFNVDVQGQAHATSAAGANDGSLLLNGAEENRFVYCTFGLDTVVKTEGFVLRFDGGAARNEFIECIFKSACETAAIPMVDFADTAGMDRYTWFRRCLFHNFSVNHANTLNQVFEIPASAQTHNIILQDCVLLGFTEWAANDRGSIFVSGPVPAAGTGGTGSSGKAVEPS